MPLFYRDTKKRTPLIYFMRILIGVSPPLHLSPLPILLDNPLFFLPLFLYHIHKITHRDKQVAPRMPS